MSAHSRNVIFTLAASASLLAACSQVGVDPAEPASIELTPFPSSAVVVGDSLRNDEGVATPVRAIVRNISGDIIDDAAVTYVYADFNRDSALIVDASTGHVFAEKQPTADARIAARLGSALQVSRTLRVTIRPDSIDRVGQPDPPELVTTLPDTSRTTATANTTGPLTVFVRHVDGEEVLPVRHWLVTYTLVHPANPTNDSTAAVFFVNENGRATAVDTTDAQGSADRRVRIRADVFPQTAEPDSIVVEVTARYRGAVLNGAPVRIVVPVQRGTPESEP